MLAGKVESPVVPEVSVADGRAQGEDGFGAVQAASGALNREAVGYQMAARKAWRRPGTGGWLSGYLAVACGEVRGEFSYSFAGLRWGQYLDVVSELEQLAH